MDCGLIATELTPKKTHSDVSVKMLTKHIIYGEFCDSHLI